MGCPNSKSKSKDLSSAAENGGNSHVTKTRNDTVQPTTESPKRMPTKTPHEYNDDPLVRGRTDDSFPDYVPPENAPVGKPDDNKNINLKSSDNSQSETSAQPIKTSEISELNHENADTSLDKTGNNLTADDILATEVKSLEKDNTVDVSDIDVGQTVSEITLENQTVEDTKAGETTENGNAYSAKTETGDTGNVKVELDTEDGYKYTEKPNKWEGSSAVRYIFKMFLYDLFLL